MTPARHISEARKLALHLESDLQALGELRNSDLVAAYAILADLDLFTLRELQQHLSELAAHCRVEINTKTRTEERRRGKKRTRR